MKYFFFFVFISFNLTFVQAQNDTALSLKLYGNHLDFYTEKPIPSVLMTITHYYDNSEVANLKSTDDGFHVAYRLFFKYDDVFRITFSAKNYLSRFLVLNLRGMKVNDIYFKGWDLPLDVPLVPVSKGSDSTLNTIIESTVTSTLTFNSSTRELEYDMVQIETYRKLVSAIGDFYNQKAVSDSLELARFEIEKKSAVQQAEISSKQTQQYFLFGGLALVIFFAVFIYRRLKIARKQQKIIEEQKAMVDEKNREILDSIHYAKRIQQSLLPSEKYINKNLKR